ncbi:ankyrin repeat domain-containing protein [Massilia pseudoviolaceinigra]|uniref:ankyrin repeat domain-containing protein n=1 Tax=Massilia pseudoviolaceinigra TaxID=3057165 RepID=UPI0027969B12|nr:ankyrin repeat domain-containing protein [Massilia sp. CCM 9206]MDQ1922302.1 ankyrin repeat domain-containing protein [Massilia sp. CCM 9206]
MNNAPRAAMLLACVLSLPLAWAAPLPNQPSALQRCPASDDGADQRRAADKPSVRAPRIFGALGKERHAALKKALAAGDNPNACHGGVTPLIMTASRGDVDAIHMLHQAGAVLDAPQSAHGGTALHAALASGQWSAARALLDRGADTRQRDDDGNTALHHLANSAHHADVRGQATLADMMLKLGAVIDQPGVHAATPLMLSIEGGNLELSAFLVDQGADPALRNARGENALAIARRRALPAMVAMLERCIGQRPPRCANISTPPRYSTK